MPMANQDRKRGGLGNAFADSSPETGASGAGSQAPLALAIFEVEELAGVLESEVFLDESLEDELFAVEELGVELVVVGLIAAGMGEKQAGIKD